MAFSLKFLDFRRQNVRQKTLYQYQSEDGLPDVIPYVALHQEEGTTVAVTGSLTTTISGTPAVTVSSGELVATGLITNPSASITRPSDTTAYASGDLLANSTDAGSVTFQSITVARASGGTAMLRRCRVRKTGTGVTNASLRVHLFSAAPTTSGGDNAALALSGAANYLGAFDVSVDRAFSDGAAGSGVPITGSEISVDLSSGTDIYMAVEVRGAYTPDSAEVFTFIFENFPN